MLYTEEAWRASADSSSHPLFKLPNISHHNIEVDELHVMHLGTTAHMLGNVLWVLCYDILPGRPSDNMKSVWHDVDELYSGLGVPCRFSNITLSSFVDPDKAHSTYPKLRGKGAEIKDLVAPLLEVWKTHQRPGHGEDAHVRRMLSHQAKLQNLLSDTAAEPFLSEADAKQVMQCIEEVLRCYTLLANAADITNKVLWSITPKFHWLWHLGDRARLLHPRRGNCMIDEDFAGAIKQIVQSCAAGTESWKVPAALVDKYRVAQHFLCVFGDEFRNA